METKPAAFSDPSEKQRAYSPVAKTFHWLTVFLVLFQFVVAAIMGGFDTFSLGTRLTGYMLHKSVGMCLLVLTIIRLDWRAKHPAPPLPASMPLWEKRLSIWVHGALYILLLLMPLSGWILISTNIHGIPFFYLFEIPTLPFILDSSLAPFWIDHAGEIHGTLGSILGTLIILHIGAALWHHFVKRDAILLRMAPRSLLPFLEYIRGRDIPSRKAPKDR